MESDTIINVVLPCVINAIFMVAGIFLNSVVVISLWRSTQLRKKLCYFTIFLLSCFDLAVVAIIHPLLIWSSIAAFWGTRKELQYAIFVFLAVLLPAYSMLALVTLNLERFLALNYPFLHQKSVTKRRVLLFVTCTCYLFTIAAALTFQNRFIKHEKLALVYLPTFLSIILYLTYRIRKIAARKKHPMVPEIANASKKTTKFHGARLLKKISVCYWTAACFIGFSIPALIYCGVCIGYWQPKEETCNRKYEQWIVTLVSANSTFNCLIFFWGNSVLSREGKKVIKCLSKRKKREVFKENVVASQCNVHVTIPQKQRFGDKFHCQFSLEK